MNDPNVPALQLAVQNILTEIDALRVRIASLEARLLSMRVDGNPLRPCGPWRPPEGPTPQSLMPWRNTDGY
jgi:hypothetical protein